MKKFLNGIYVKTSLNIYNNNNNIDKLENQKKVFLVSNKKIYFN